MSQKPAENTFDSLLPEDIMASLESAGWQCDGRIQALASYENRVYLFGLIDNTRCVAKFYRPQRWSDEQIMEEYAFTDELNALDLPVLTPLESPSGQTLCHFAGHRFAVYPFAPGQAPSPDNESQLEQIGRLLGRLHNVGFAREFADRETISFEHRAVDAARFLIDGNWIPPELLDAYMAIAEPLLAALDDLLGDSPWQDHGRLHGDMHVGNLLWHQNSPALLDFDDAVNGPAMQDLWMFLSGDQNEMQRNLDALVNGYEMFRRFPNSELPLVEGLRAMRIFHHARWLAMRWSDPAFPRAFPWFNTQKFWQDHILTLKEQLALLQDPPRLAVEFH